MDRLIYVAATGAKSALARQDTLAHNLANANTTGFRAVTTAFRAVPVVGAGAPSRAFSLESTPGTDFVPGTIQQTGRELDVAVNGRGFIAVQGPDGIEGYTRAGNLQVDDAGTLKTALGFPVLSDGGPITIPPDHRIAIAADGTISAMPTTGKNVVNTVGRIKLVNPPESALVRGADALFRLRDGAPAEADERVRLVAGSLEGSNVNAVEAMIGMIAVARQFDLNMRMLQSADQNARAASQLVAARG